MPSFLENLRMRNLFRLPEGEMVGDSPYMHNTTIFDGGGFGDMSNPRPTSIFGGGIQPPQPMDEIPRPNAGGDDIVSRMREIYTPETRATDRFNQLLDERPERNKPGMLRKIASIAAAGLSGRPENVDKLMFAPYHRKMADWESQIEPSYKAATIERQSNVNERTVAMQTISAQLREDAQRAKEMNDTRRADIAQQRADVYEYKARNPNLRIDFSGPEVIAIDPQTGQRAPITDTNGKPVLTGNMSEADKLAFQRETTMKSIGARGAESRRTQEEGHEQELEEIEARGSEARRTRQTPTAASTASGNKPELPTQTRVRQFNAARELYNSRPELRPFIKLGKPGSNDFEIVPPGKGFFGATGPNPQQYEEITGKVYQGAMSRQAGSRGAGPGPGKTEPIYKTQRNTSTGATRRVMSTDGGKTWKPAPAGS